MAAPIINKLSKKSLPKSPVKNAAKKTWDAYEKKKKEVIAYNKAVDKEIKRRDKIKSLK